MDDDAMGGLDRYGKDELGNGGPPAEEFVGGGPVVPENAAVETDANALGAVQEWAGCFPQHVLDMLFKVSVEDKGSNPKVFWSSYPKDWVKLTDTQRNKARAFWTNLTVSKQQELLVAARLESDKAPAVPAPVAGPARERPTTKHEVSRLMHMMKDVNALAAWGRVTQKFRSRAELDARKSDAPGASGSSMASEINGWGQLTEMFNDPDNFYENVGVAYREVEGSQRPVKVNPYVARDPAYLAIVARTHDIDPNQFSQRTEEWLKATYTTLKSSLTVISQRFHASGHQNADGTEEYEWKDLVNKEILQKTASSWTNFACNSKTWPDAMQYAYMLLEKSDFDFLGKMLPSGCGDGGDPTNQGKRARDSEADRVARKQATKEGAARKEESIVYLLKEAARSEEERGLMQIMIQCGDAAMKAHYLAIVEEKLKQLAARPAVDTPGVRSRSSSSAASHTSSSSRYSGSDADMSQLDETE